MKIIVKIIAATGETSQIKLVAASQPALHLQAAAGSHYIVMAESGELAADKIQLQQSGDDLLLSFSEQDSQTVIIKQYFDPIVGQDTLLLGKHKNGQYYTLHDSGTFNNTQTDQAITNQENQLATNTKLENTTSLDEGSLSTAFPWLIVSAVSALGLGVGLLAQRHKDSSKNLYPEMKRNVYVATTAIEDDTEKPGFTNSAHDFVTTDNTLIIKGVAYNLHANDEIQLSFNKRDWLSVDHYDRMTNEWLFDHTNVKLPIGKHTIYTRIIESNGNMLTSHFLDILIERAVVESDDGITSYYAEQHPAVIGGTINSQSFRLKENSEEIKKEQVIFELLPEYEDHHFGGFKETLIMNFKLGNFNTDPGADRLVFKDFFSDDISPQSPISVLEKYFHVENFGKNYGAKITLDRDGDGNRFSFDDADADESFNANFHIFLPHAEYATLQMLIDNQQLVF